MRFSPPWETLRNTFLSNFRSCTAAQIYSRDNETVTKFAMFCPSFVTVLSFIWLVDFSLCLVFGYFNFGLCSYGQSTRIYIWVHVLSKKIRINCKLKLLLSFRLLYRCVFFLQYLVVIAGRYRTMLIQPLYRESFSENRSRKDIRDQTLLCCVWDSMITNHVHNLSIFLKWFCIYEDHVLFSRLKSC